MRHNCLTGAPSISAVIVQLFKNASLFFQREWPCPAPITKVYPMLLILIVLINIKCIQWKYKHLRANWRVGALLLGMKDPLFKKKKIPKLPEVLGIMAVNYSETQHGLNVSLG